MSPDARSARTRFLILRATRWFPTGLLMPVLVLFMVDRGLTLTQIGIVSAAQGMMVMVLELPTGGLADALGRRQVLMIANGFDVVTLVLMLVGESLWWFVAAWAIQGVFRALESGPLDAWYVDAANAAGAPDSVERGLSLGGVVLGLAIGAGAVASGGLVALGGVSDRIDALVLPFVVALGVRLVDSVLIRRLMDEIRPPAGLATFRRAATEVPEIVRSSVALFRASTVLALLVAVELTWGFGMPAFEALFPVRLAEVLDSPDRAAAMMGPIVAVAWVISAGGAAVVTWFSARFGRIRAAAAMRLLQAATVVAMGVFAGPIGVITGYLGCYAVHGAANPVHQTLIHDEAEARNRATVLSLNSLMGMAAGSVGGIVLGVVADHGGVPVGMYLGALVLALGAPLYLVADRVGRRRGGPPFEAVVVEQSLSSR